MKKHSWIWWIIVGWVVLQVGSMILYVKDPTTGKYVSRF